MSLFAALREGAKNPLVKAKTDRYGNLKVSHPLSDLESRLYKLPDLAETSAQTPSLGLRASGLGDLCPREFTLLNQLSSIQTKPSDYMKEFYCGIGTAVHSILQNTVFREVLVGCGAGNYVEPSARESDTLLQGHNDGIVCLNRLKSLEAFLLERGSQQRDEYLDLKKTWAKMPVDPIILEVKTTNSDKFRGLQEGKDELRSEYQIQAAAYQYLFSVNKTLFLYLNRDNGAWHSIEFVAQESLWNEVCWRLHEIHESQESGKMPSRFCCPTKSHYRAKACPVSNECFAHTHDTFPKSKQKFPPLDELQARGFDRRMEVVKNPSLWCESFNTVIVSNVTK